MIEVEVLSKQATQMSGKSKYVKINGILDEDSYYSEWANGTRHVILYNEKLIEEIILGCTSQEINEHFDFLKFYWNIDSWEFWFTLEFIFDKDRLLSKNFLKVEINIENEEWNRPYSIKKFASEIQKTSELNPDFGSKCYFDDDDFITNGFGLLFEIENKPFYLSEIIDKYIGLVEQHIKFSHSSLMSEEGGDVLSVYFRFPEEIKTSCKQYLIYFAQFLSDLGIDARTEIKDEIEGILFRVMPESSQDALSKVREALDIYIYAASSDGYKVISDSNVENIALLQWKSNILYFQSQLMLSQSLIEAKDATIESLKLSNYQYRKLLESQIETENEERIAGGLVKVKEYEGNGFRIDLPAIIRALKRKLKF